MAEANGKVAVGSDHAGYRLKDELARLLEGAGLSVEDHGPGGPESVDYPDFGASVARAVAAGEADFGVLVCGTGIGMSIVANKVAGIRAALCRTELEARMAREHNDANILCIGERITGAGLARAILEAWLATGFAGGRHQRRLDKIGQVEKERD